MRSAANCVWAAILLATVSWSCATPEPMHSSLPGASAVVESQSLAAADRMLAELRPKLGVYPPRFAWRDERGEITRKWRAAEAELNAVARRLPDDAQVHWRLGELYRFGYNLDVPEAGDRCVAHLERALALRPQFAEARLELGLYYADRGPRWAAQAELNLKKALQAAGARPLPRAWRSLAFAYYYQGKLDDAVRAADRALHLAPEDPALRRLREIALEDAQRNGSGGGRGRF